MGSRSPGEGQCSLTHAIKCAIRKSKVEQFSKEIQFLGLKRAKKGCCHPSRHRSCLEQGENTAQPMSTCGRQNQPSCQKKQWIGPRRERYGPNPQTPWWRQSHQGTILRQTLLWWPKVLFLHRRVLQTPKQQGLRKAAWSVLTGPAAGPRGAGGEQEPKQRPTVSGYADSQTAANSVWRWRKITGAEKKWLKWWCKPAWAAETGQQAAAPWYDAWLGKAVQVPLSLWDPGKVSTSELCPMRQQCLCCGSIHTIFPHLFK